MEHMKMKWNTYYRYVDKFWVVYADASAEDIFTVEHYLHGDDTGELTARAICDEHNKMLGLE